MGDGYKLPKGTKDSLNNSTSRIHIDRRHRSSSSLAGNLVEATRSERKLDSMNASILEVDDQFALAESRCDDLQEKLDMLKSLKKKRKLKKRSATKISDQIAAPENMVHISVRTQPKKKVTHQASRLRRLEVPPNPTRNYVDPATVEQHRMIGQVRGYNHASKQPFQEYSTGNQQHSGGQRQYQMSPQRRPYAEGDTMLHSWTDELSSHQDDFCGSSFDQRQPDVVVTKKAVNSPVAKTTGRRRNVPPKKIIAEEERPVVELFKTCEGRENTPPDLCPSSGPPSPPSYPRRKVNDSQNIIAPTENDPSVKSRKSSATVRRPRRIKYRSHRYELPTVASQMKQAGVRYYYGSNTNRTNIPFVVSKSTAPSHNIGVNIQQVLNGLKIQQPLSGIPLTIAHHMGLGHIPNAYKMNGTPLQPSLGPSEINAIKVGRKLVRLPSYKYISYNRLLTLYREGDGMVPRFLRAISRPHFFYTSMYNLNTNREDCDGATSKGRGGSNEAKQSLAEYARLYRDYEKLEKMVKEGSPDPELERRREELEKQLAAREDHIRRVVQDYRSNAEAESVLRASASIAEDTYRHSKFKLNDSKLQ